jgi:chorismate dehydratase
MLTSIGVTCSKFTRISLEREIRIGAVSYLNTKPLLFGLNEKHFSYPFQLTLDYPANLVKAIQEDKIDIGLLPVAAIQHLDDFQVVSKYCIGALGEVASVCLYSNVPIKDIKKVKLDYQSRTSVLLCKLLLKEFYHQDVEFVPAQTDQELLEFNEESASLIIGDRALRLNGQTKFRYDLALNWREMTGLPFVFAVWVSKRHMSPEFIQSFDQAVGYGVQHIDQVVSAIGDIGVDLEVYYKKNISYDFDEQKKQGMQLYLEKIQQLV